MSVSSLHSATSNEGISNIGKDMDVDMVCSSCNESIHLDMGNWLPCSECDQSFHLYCLDPLPMEKPKGKWICPLHDKTENQTSNTDNEDLNSMILFPYQIIPRTAPPSKRRVKRTPLKSIIPSHISDLQAELLLSKASNQQQDHPILRSIMKQNKDKLLSDYYGELKSVQNKLIPAALDMVSADNLNMSASNANATLQMMSSFSPLFIQFLAWQRLMQLQDEVGLFDNPVAPWSDPKPPRKRTNPPPEPDRGETPAKKRRTESDSTKDINLENEVEPPHKRTQQLEKKMERPVRKAGRPPKRKSGYAVRTSNSAVSTSPTPSEVTPPPKRKTESIKEATLEDMDKEIDARPTEPLRRKEVIQKPSNSIPTKSLSTTSITEDTESITEAPSKPKQKVDIIPIDQDDTNTSNDPTSKSKILPMPQITPQTEILVTLCAEFLFNPVTRSLGAVKNMPLRIGRCDPRSPTPHKLSLNLQEIFNDSSVKRVSHSHVEIIARDNTLYLICLGRNGILLEDNSLLQKSQTVAVENGMIFRVGPFQITLHVS